MNPYVALFVVCELPVTRPSVSKLVTLLADADDDVCVTRPIEFATAGSS